MKRALLPAAFVVALTGAFAPSAAAQGGIVTGVVVRWPSGEPAAGAPVKLTDEPPSVGPAGHQTQSTTTSADGSFRFDNVEPGTYYVVANIQGYLPTEYGQRTPTGTGIAFDVAAGQRVSVRLTAWPTGSISGRVVDADGDPVGRVQVIAMRFIYRQGKPETTLAQSVMTNDRGEYRMFWLTPGTYRVATREWDPDTWASGVNIGPPKRFGTADQSTGPIVHGRMLPNGGIVEETEIPIYAPSTPDPQLASTIALAAGDSATNVDIQLVGNRVPARHVRGTVASADGKPFSGPPGVRILTMVPKVTLPITRISTAVLAADGSFDLDGLAPGSYILFARDGEIAQPVDVGDADVTVTLTEPPKISLEGHLTFDRGMSAASANPNPSDLQIRMTREPDLPAAPTGGPGFNRPPFPNGTITLNNIPPGDYRVDMWPFAFRSEGAFAAGRPFPDGFANAYVKSIRLGSVDVLADGLHLWAPTQASFDVVIGLNGAQVEGTATDNGRQPAANITIVAVPDGSNKGRSDLYRTTTTDRRGRFSIEGLAPADYTFYAWDDVERGAWESPEFMRAFDGRGRFVRLREGKNEALDLSVLVGR
jgi:hypothetical protein